VRKFKCSICGFIFEEAAGLPEKGISPGTKWEDISAGFVCPWCGASKTAFVEVSENVAATVPAIQQEGPVEQVGEFTVGELSALFSNLAKGCEKQHLPEEMGLFLQISDYYRSTMHAASIAKPAPENTYAAESQAAMKDDGPPAASLHDYGFHAVSELLREDLSDGFANANRASAAERDRGALRALVWSEKVSRMAGSHLDRYAREGDAILENTKVYVCDICGFVYLGNDLPEVCPVCKVPNYKMTQIGRR